MRFGPALFLSTLVILLVGSGVAHTRTLKLATVAPEGSSWMREMRQVAKQVEQKTEGRVRLKFYPGGVMGSDKTVLRKIRVGQLQGGAFASGGLSGVYPDLGLYGLPLMFHTYDEVDYVRERMDEAMIAGLEQAGYVALAITDGGLAYLMSRQPARQVSDLSRAKVWIQEGDTMSMVAFDIAGVSPVQLALADVYTALQTGLVDTVAAPAMGAIALQWHTKVKYLTDVPLTRLTGAFVLDRKAFEKLRPEDQQALREIVGRAGERLDAETRSGEENARQALRDQGIEFVTATTPEELERWHDIADQALIVLREQGIYSDAMIDEIQGHLADYRRSRAGSED